MKSYLIFIIPFLFSFTLNSQDKVWSTEIHKDDINLRLPLATVLAQLDLDIPSNGRVVVSFDGYCKSSPGDRIVVASSDINNWRTNDGNLGIYIYNSTNVVQSFGHQRIYNVSTGKQSFYAIGHNFVDTEGSGIASIHGTLVVEFYSNSPGSQFFAGKGFYKYPIILNGNPQVISSEKIVVPSKGKVIVSHTSSIYSTSNNEIEIALSNSTAWPLNDNTSPVNIVNTYVTRYANISKIFEVESGSHEFNLLARKNKGDLTNPNNAVYGNMTIQYFPDQKDKSELVSDQFKLAKISSGAPLSALSKLSFNAPFAGQVILNSSGKFNEDIPETLQFKITNQPVTSLSNPDLKVQKLHPENGDEYYSTSKVYNVVQGINDFYFYGAFENSVSPSNKATISGNFTLKYIPNPMATSISESEIQKNEYSFFPNPTSGNLYLDTNGNSLEMPLEVLIYDINGKLIKKNLDSTQGSIDMSELQDGVYLLQSLSKGRLVSNKIVKLK